MYKYDLGHILSSMMLKLVVVELLLYRVSCTKSERESGRRGSCLLVVTAACGEGRGDTRGRCPCAPIVCNLLIIVHLAVCGLPWFFPPLWVFHVNVGVISHCYLCFSVFLVHTSTVRLWPNKQANRILTKWYQSVVW